MIEEISRSDDCVEYYYFKYRPVSLSFLFQGWQHLLPLSFATTPFCLRKSQSQDYTVDFGKVSQHQLLCVAYVTIDYYYPHPVGEQTLNWSLMRIVRTKAKGTLTGWLKFWTLFFPLSRQAYKAMRHKVVP